MGILSWLLCGAVTVAACRFIPLGRLARRLPEVLCGLAFALIGGLLATRLDFGGWSTLDPRAVLFSAVTALCGVAIARVTGALASGRVTVTPNR